jgi:hypothetical protein
MIRMISSDICQKAKTIVVLVVCVSRRLEPRWHPRMDIGKPSFEKPNGYCQKYYIEE